LQLKTFFPEQCAQKEGAENSRNGANNNKRDIVPHTKSHRSHVGTGRKKLFQLSLRHHRFSGDRILALLNNKQSISKTLINEKGTYFG